MTAVTIDLNADLGEGFGRWSLTDDVALLDSVTSANVACGFHAGDPAIMRRVCGMAAERDVAIGAHVAYRDLAGFGRRAMDVPAEELAAEVAYQIGALEVFAAAAGPGVTYVKPHGALYNRVAHDWRQAAAVIDGIVLASEATGRDLAVMGLAGSQLLEAAAQAGLPTISEAFADRAYLPDGTLAPRSEGRSVITEPQQVVARSIAIGTGQPVMARDGSQLTITAQSLCVHGDTPGAAALAAQVRAALESAGVQLRAYAHDRQ